VTVLSSTDNVVFTPIPGAPTTFAGGIPTVSFAQPISFAPVAASFIRFQINSNYGNTAQTGFSETAFSGTAAAVPEPGTLALTGLGVLGLVAWLQRRRMS
jgi:hypothetical protein